jgi:hypothetical protein
MRRIQSDVSVGGGIGASYTAQGSTSAQHVHGPQSAKDALVRKSSVASLIETDQYSGPKSQVTPIDDAVKGVAAGGISTPAGWVFPSDRPILLFNSDCAVCRKISGWVIANDDPKNGGAQRIDERPIGYDPEELRKLNPNLDIWNAYETIHVLMPDGSMKTGGEAVGEVFRRLPKTAWSSPLLDFSMFGWKPFQGAVNVGYTVLDKLRPAMGCESCGKPVPWWGKPVAWAFQAWNKISPPAPTPVPGQLEAPKPAEGAPQVTPLGQ